MSDHGPADERAASTFSAAASVPEYLHPTAASWVRIISAMLAVALVLANPIEAMLAGQVPVPRHGCDPQREDYITFGTCVDRETDSGKVAPIAPGDQIVIYATVLDVMLAEHWDDNLVSAQRARQRWLVPYLLAPGRDWAAFDSSSSHAAILRDAARRTHLLGLCDIWFGTSTADWKPCQHPSDGEAVALAISPIYQIDSEAVRIYVVIRLVPRNLKAYDLVAQQYVFRVDHRHEKWIVTDHRFVRTM